MIWLQKVSRIKKPFKGPEEHVESVPRKNIGWLSMFVLGARNLCVSNVPDLCALTANKLAILDCCQYFLYLVPEVGVLCFRFLVYYILRKKD